VNELTVETGLVSAEENKCPLSSLWANISINSFTLRLLKPYFKSGVQFSVANLRISFLTQN
jgi:hypothetical protein